MFPHGSSSAEGRPQTGRPPLGWTLRRERRSTLFSASGLRTECPSAGTRATCQFDSAPALEGEDLAGEQLCQILSRRYGIRRGRVEETLESFSAGKLLAKALKIAQGFPLLLLQDTLYTERDEIYEFSRVYFRGDRTKIHLEYRD